MLDVRELFNGGLLAKHWYSDLSERVSSTRLSILSLKHVFTVSSIPSVLHFQGVDKMRCQRRLGGQTKLHVISKLGQLDQDDLELVKDLRQFGLLRGNVLGVVSHQYSPTKQLQVSIDQSHSRGPTF